MTGLLKVTWIEERDDTALCRAGTVKEIVGAAENVLFCAPGVPLLPTDALQEVAARLSRAGFVSSSEGPFPSGAVGQAPASA